MKTPTARFLYWIAERDRIRKKRLLGREKPWTNDPILQKYKFCNVRRMDDRVSQWLMQNWYIPNYGHKNMFLACSIARLFNHTDSLTVANFPKVWRPERFRKKMKQHKSIGGKVFGAAYIISTNGESGNKIDIMVDSILPPLADFKDYSTDSIEELTNEITKFPGIGTFIGGQIVADLRHAVPGKWADAKSWAAIGPGSRRGINRLLGRDKKTPVKQAQFNDELPKVIELVERELPEIAERLEAIDVQNCLCEFDKYERTMFEGRRPKQNYRGV